MPPPTQPHLDPAVRPAKQKPVRPPPAPPKPPPLELYVEVGDTVHWYPGADPGEAGQLAVVTQRLIDTKVSCTVIHPLMTMLMPQDGAYHMSHPKAQIDNSGGGWRHRPITIAIRRMLIEVGVLEWNEECTDLVPAKPKPPAEVPPAEPKPKPNTAA